jgi:acetyltransferase
MSLDKIFNPKSIAIIGASDTRDSVGYALYVNAMKSSRKRPVYPVNLKKKKILGAKAYAKVGDIKRKIDLAVIATPAITVPGVLKECAEAGIKAAVVISAGFNEVGAEGQKLFDELGRVASENEIRVLGPNCLGFINPLIDLNMSFAAKQALPGQVALVSQSGAICTALLDWSLSKNIGFSNFVSLGSALNIGFSDVLEHLAEDKKTTSIVLYMESLRNPARFAEVCRKVSKVKPVFVLKSGRSQAGALAAKSHTGSLAGNDLGFDALFRQASASRLDTIEQLFDIITMCSVRSKNIGRRLAIITNAGGPGVLSTDAAYLNGGELAKLSKETLARLSKKLPAAWSQSNPIDIIGDADPKRYKDAMAICLADSRIDSVLTVLTPQTMTDPLAVASEIGKLKIGKNKFVMASFIGGLEVRGARERLEKRNIPVFDTPERAISSFIRLTKQIDRREKEISNEKELPLAMIEKEKAGQILNKARLEKRKQLSESEAKELLACYGIPVLPFAVVDSRAKAETESSKLKYPVAMKILSPDILHKIDCGGVALDIGDTQSAGQAYDAIIRSAKRHHPKARIHGVYIEPMVKSDFELIIGFSYDPVLGGLIMFGRGGSEVELIKDISFGVLPLNSLEIADMIKSTKVYSRIAGYRNLPGIDPKVIVDIIRKIALLIHDFPNLKELDINPLSIHSGQALALDAKVVLK